MFLPIKTTCPGEGLQNGFPRNSAPFVLFTWHLFGSFVGVSSVTVGVAVAEVKEAASVPLEDIELAVGAVVAWEASVESSFVFIDVGSEVASAVVPRLVPAVAPALVPALVAGLVSEPAGAVVDSATAGVVVTGTECMCQLRYVSGCQQKA